MSENWICFHSKVFGKDTKVCIISFRKKANPVLYYICKCCFKCGIFVNICVVIIPLYKVAFTVVPNSAGSNCLSPTHLSPPRPAPHPPSPGVSRERSTLFTRNVSHNQSQRGTLNLKQIFFKKYLCRIVFAPVNYWRCLEKQPLNKRLTGAHSGPSPAQTEQELEHWCPGLTEAYTRSPQGTQMDTFPFSLSTDPRGAEAHDALSH